MRDICCLHISLKWERRPTDCLFVNEGSECSQIDSLLHVRLHWEHDIGRDDLQSGVSLHTESSPNEFSWGFKFANEVSKVAGLHNKLFWKLDDVSASLMRRQHLISKTNYTAEGRILFASAKMEWHETWGSPSAVKHRQKHCMKPVQSTVWKFSRI